MAFTYVTLTILEVFPLVFSIIYLYLIVHKLKGGLPWWLRWQRIHLQYGRPGFNLWVGKIPWRRAWQPTPVFSPGESPWTEEPGRLPSTGSQRVRHNWATKHTHKSKGMILKATGPVVTLNGLWVALNVWRWYAKISLMHKNNQSKWRPGPRPQYSHEFSQDFSYTTICVSSW